jgi:hypothetical protein
VVDDTAYMSQEWYVRADISVRVGSCSIMDMLISDTCRQSMNQYPEADGDGGMKTRKEMRTRDKDWKTTSI